MNGYIYTLYQGADPGRGWVLNDPIFGKKPTLGACVPNIRRNVKIGDWVFAISGRVAGERQYVVGGFQVEEKISQLAALNRFPENQVRLESGQVVGNVIVDENGNQHPVDNHSNFERRLENYLIGGDAVELTNPEQIAVGRAETLAKLAEIFERPGNRPYDVIGRARKMDEEQVVQLKDWLDGIRAHHP